MTIQFPKPVVTAVATGDETGLDWGEIARLPTVTAEAGDLDVVELVQRGLIAPTVRVTHAALAVLGAVDTVVITDVEATPLLLGRLRSGQLEASTLRTVAKLNTEAASLADRTPTDLAVIVRSLPSAADLVRLDALTDPDSHVTWLVLAGRTRAGRRLLADVPDVIAARTRGRHRIVRVPWPAPGSRGVFERPTLPSPHDLADAFGASDVVVVGEVPGIDQPRHHRGGTVVFFTGLSGSGKSTIAKALRPCLVGGTVLGLGTTSSSAPSAKSPCSTVTTCVGCSARASASTRRGAPPTCVAPAGSRPCWPGTAVSRSLP